MPELDDRIPGGVILASYSNLIRDRTAQRYVDETARDTETPIPGLGELAYITGSQVLQHFDGIEWHNFLDDAGDLVIDGSISATDIIGQRINATQRFFGPLIEVPRANLGNNLFGGPSILTWFMTSSIANPEGAAWRAEPTAGDTWRLQVATGDGAGNPQTYRTRIDFREPGGGAIYGITDFSEGAGSPTSPMLNFPASFNVYAVTDGSVFTATLRNILVGAGVPNNAVGVDGDIFFRF